MCHILYTVESSSYKRGYLPGGGYWGSEQNCKFICFTEPLLLILEVTHSIIILQY